MKRDRENREKQLFRCIPSVLDYKTLLYIGARKGLIQMLDLFVAASYTIDMLEIWPPNVEWIKTLKGVRRVIEADVRDVLKKDFSTYDIVMWWHGPEHVYQKELEKILSNLKSLAEIFVIVACPWGVNYQGKRKANIHEEHVSSLYPETFRDFGWQVDTIGEKDVPGSNLLAWSKNE